MAFTLIPLGPSSFAIAFVKEFIAPFVAEYTASQEAPLSPHIEEMLIMFPLFLLTILGIARCVQFKTDLKLTSIILFQSSGVISLKSPKCAIPALLTNISIFP